MKEIKDDESMDMDARMDDWSEQEIRTRILVSVSRYRRHLIRLHSTLPYSSDYFPLIF